MTKLSVELSIEEMQAAIVAKGWQYTEHAFNDGLYGDCMIELTNNKSPHALGATRWTVSWPGNKMPTTIGWGRFSRRFCWAQAYDCIVVECKYDNVDM